MSSLSRTHPPTLELTPALWPQDKEEGWAEPGAGDPSWEGPAWGSWGGQPCPLQSWGWGSSWGRRRLLTASPFLLLASPPPGRASPGTVVQGAVLISCDDHHRAELRMASFSLQLTTSFLPKSPQSTSRPLESREPGRFQCGPIQRSSNR